MIYPTDTQIEEYFAHLSPDLAEQLQPLLREGQRNYHRVRRLNPIDHPGMIEVLREHAAAVFQMRTARRLNEGMDFESFRKAISMEGGEAELAMWSAHRLYNLVEGGRMLAIWHREIEPRLWPLMREAEDSWWEREAVLEGGNGVQPQGDAAVDPVPVAAAPVQAEAMPASVAPVAEARWEDLHICFLSDERVEITVGDQRETRNYGEMGFEDRRNGKPNEAWRALRELAENRGALPVGTGKARSSLTKRVQELRKILKEIHAAPGDPLPYLHGEYRAQFPVECRRSYRS